MNRFFAFGRHIADIGKRTHPKMAAWVPALNARLSQGVPTTRIVSWFDKSGNFVVDSNHDDPLVIAERLHEASERPFAVLPVEDLHEGICCLNALIAPGTEYNFRWTLGASFNIGRHSVQTAKDKAWVTKNGHYFWLTENVVGVWKKDRLAHPSSSGPAMTLERKHRDPWGVVSVDIATKLGGKWTSRSAKTIFGLAQCSG